MGEIVTSGISAAAPVATVVVGNPRLASRTAAAAVAVARGVQRHAGFDHGEVTLIELSQLSSGLLTGADPAVSAAKGSVLASDLLVVACPVYKASFSGLLKAFLDHFDRDELAAMPTVPMMLGASAMHALSVEHHLRPVLIEIGASCPTRGLYMLEREFELLDHEVSNWLRTWGDVLAAALRARAEIARL